MTSRALVLLGKAVDCLLEPFAVIGEAVIWLVAEVPFSLFNLCRRVFFTVRTHPRGLRGATLELSASAAVAARRKATQVAQRPFKRLCFSRHAIGLALLLAMSLSPMAMLAVLHGGGTDGTSDQHRVVGRRFGSTVPGRGLFDSQGHWVKPPPERDPREVEEESKSARWRVWKDLWRRWWYGGAGEVVCSALLVEPRVRRSGTKGEEVGLGNEVARFD